MTYGRVPGSTPDKQPEALLMNDLLRLHFGKSFEGLLEVIDICVDEKFTHNSAKSYKNHSFLVKLQDLACKSANK